MDDEIILPSAPIAAFETHNNPVDGDLLVIVDKLTGKTKNMNVSRVTPAQPSTNYKWVSTFDYPVDNIVEHAGKWFVSLQTPNLGKNPNAFPLFWEERVKSASGFVYWKAGIYTGEAVIVLRKTGGKTYIYELVNPTRPFLSSDFDVELAAGDWELIGAGSSLYDLASPTTVTVGGLPSGTDITGWTVNEILQAMVTGTVPLTVDSTDITVDDDVITSDQITI